MSDTRWLLPPDNEPLKPAPDRTEPQVWVRRLVLLERLEPELEPIRTVELRRGLNIIATATPNPGDGAVGHNVGKTLFTRLIRYCLGEQHFARLTVRTAIAARLPNAHVVAEIFVSGRPWVVARPIGAPGSESWCMESGDWRQLVENMGTAMRFSVFQDELQAVLVEPFAETELPHSGSPVRWRDLLAWLSRDQYCRYRDPLEWRTKATESGTAELDPEDASTIIRLAMDLLDDEERDLIRRHKQLLGEKATLAAEIRDTQSELGGTRRFLQLRAKVKEELLQDDLFGEQAKVRLRRRRQQLRQQRESLGEESGLKALAKEAQAAHAIYTKVQHDLEMRQADRDVLEGELAQHGSSQKESLIESLSEMFHPCELPPGQCPMKPVPGKPGGRDPVREVLARQAMLDLRDLDQTLADLQNQSTAVEQGWREAQERHDRLANSVAKRDQHLAMQIARIEALIREVEAYLKTAKVLREKEGEFEKVDRRLTNSRDSQRAVREQMIARQHKLNEHFNFVLRSLLGPQSRGRIEIDMRGVHLIPDESEPSPGEAMATSGTVHSLDLACLRGSIAGLGFLPRFLIHDSPREGDLEPHLYARLFEFALSLEHAFDGREPSFQYIVATTTPPPDTARREPYLRLQLDARNSDGVLLRRRF